MGVDGNREGGGVTGQAHAWLVGTDLQMEVDGVWSRGTITEWYRDAASGVFWVKVKGAGWTRRARVRDLLFVTLPVGAVL